jgi:hypothetical protein
MQELRFYRIKHSTYFAIAEKPGTSGKGVSVGHTPSLLHELPVSQERGTLNEEHRESRADDVLHRIPNILIPDEYWGNPERPR